MYCYVQCEHEIEKDENPDKADASESTNDTDIQSQKSGESKKEIRRKKAERRKEINAALKPIETKLAKLEEMISQLESREKEISGQLADPELFKDLRTSKQRSIVRGVANHIRNDIRLVDEAGRLEDGQFIVIAQIIQ